MKFSFDNHILDTDLRELRRDRELVAMQPQVFREVHVARGSRSQAFSEAIVEQRPLAHCLDYPGLSASVARRAK